MNILTSVPKLGTLLKAGGVENAMCIEAGDIIFASGFTGIDLENGQISDGSFEQHVHEAIDCFELIYERIGLTLDNVIKVNCFLLNPVEDFPTWNRVFKERFRPPFPCRTSVGSPLIAGRIEVEMVAHRSSRLKAKIVG